MAIAFLSCIQRLLRAALLVGLCASFEHDAQTGLAGSCSRPQQDDVVAPHIIIKYPPDGTVIRDYRDGGKGHAIRFDYEVENMPCGGASKISIARNGEHIGYLTRQFRDHVVNNIAITTLRFRLTPGHYHIEVVVVDDGGKEQKRVGASVEIELPAYAQRVRVFGTHDTLSAILDAIASNESGAYLRFGDGDIQIASSRDDQMQAEDAALTMEAQVLVRYFSTGSYIFEYLNTFSVPRIHRQLWLWRENRC